MKENNLDFLQTICFTTTFSTINTITDFDIYYYSNYSM